MEHLSRYQARDFEVVDYAMYKLPLTELQFRGPQTEHEEKQYFSCLGAAQTFGCFCEKPYCNLLAESIGLPALNLGYGGAGPRFFLRHSELLRHVNRGRFAIIQVMSGRSEDNSLFESKGLEYLTWRRDGKRMSADGAWRNVLEYGFTWKHLPFGRQLARRICQRLGAKRARALVDETRSNWLDSYRQLLDAIEVPKILFWFSKRSPDYLATYESLQTMFGAFPQLVDRAMVESLSTRCDEYVECVTRRGSPQPLCSRFTGDPVEVDLSKDRPDFAGQKWTENAYYPSPQMHEDASNALYKTAKLLCQRVKFC